MREALAQLQSMGLSLSQSVAVLARSLGIQATASAALEIFWFSSLLAVAVIAMIWFTHPTRHQH